MTPEDQDCIAMLQDDLIYNDPLYKQGFQAGAASRDAEVAEHLEEITALKEVIKHGDAQRDRDMELFGQERDQLRAELAAEQIKSLEAEIARLKREDFSHERVQNDSLRLANKVATEQIKVARGTLEWVRAHYPRSRVVKEALAKLGEQ